MFNKLEATFNEVNATLASNREEIKEMAYRTSVNIEDQGRPIQADEPAVRDDEEFPDDDGDYSER